MYSLTIHNMDAAVYNRLYSMAEERELSLNQLVKRLLRDASESLAPLRRRKPDFSCFAGKWTPDETKAFNARTARSVDAGDWA